MGFARHMSVSNGSKTETINLYDSPSDFELADKILKITQSGVEYYVPMIRLDMSYSLPEEIVSDIIVKVPVHDPVYYSQPNHSVKYKSYRIIKARKYYYQVVMSPYISGYYSVPYTYCDNYGNQSQTTYLPAHSWLVEMRDMALVCAGSPGHGGAGGGAGGCSSPWPPSNGGSGGGGGGGGTAGYYGLPMYALIRDNHSDSKAKGYKLTGPNIFMTCTSGYGTYNPNRTGKSGGATGTHNGSEYAKGGTQNRQDCSTSRSLIVRNEMAPRVYAGGFGYYREFGWRTDGIVDMYKAVYNSSDPYHTNYELFQTSFNWDTTTRYLLESAFWYCRLTNNASGLVYAAGGLGGRKGTGPGGSGGNAYCSEDGLKSGYDGGPGVASNNDKYGHAGGSGGGNGRNDWSNKWREPLMHWRSIDKTPWRTATASEALSYAGHGGYGGKGGNGGTGATYKGGGSVGGTGTSGSYGFPGEVRINVKVWD